MHLHLCQIANALSFWDRLLVAHAGQELVEAKDNPKVLIPLLPSLGSVHHQSGLLVLETQLRPSCLQAALYQLRAFLVCSRDGLTSNSESLRLTVLLSQPPKYSDYSLHTLFCSWFFFIINGVFVGTHVTEHLQPSEDNFVESVYFMGFLGGQTLMPQGDR